MHLHKYRYKNQNTRNLPQRYNYSSNNAISSFKQTKMLQHLSTREFLKNRMGSHFHLTASLPACQQEQT